MLVAQYQQQGQEQQQLQQHYPQQVQGYAQQEPDPGQVQMPFQPQEAEKSQGMPEQQMAQPEQHVAAA